MVVGEPVVAHQIAGEGFGSPKVGTAAPGLRVSRAPEGGAAWVVTLDVPYCGGYAVGDGVYLELLDSFTWPDTVQPGSVSFADGPANVSLDRMSGVLQVKPAAGRIWAQFCLANGTVPLTVMLAPSLGLAAPNDGDEALEVRTPSSPPRQHGSGGSRPRPRAL